MAHEGYHEPYELLSDFDKDYHRIIQSTMEELEAVDWYNQRAAVAADPVAKGIMEHNRDEEIEHACMGIEWLRRNSPVWEQNLRTFLFSAGDILHAEEAMTSGEATPSETITTTGDNTMSIFKREKATIQPEVWAEIDTMFQEALNTRLISRKVIETSAARGLDFSALGTGTKESAGEGVAVRKSLPVLECRCNFTIDKDDVEDLLRGAKSLRHDASMMEAVAKFTEVENQLVFEGNESAGISGIMNGALEGTLSESIDELPKTLVMGVESLRKEDVEGPFALLVGEALYAEIYAAPGYPMSSKIQQILGEGGQIILASFLEKNAILMTLRGGDYELVPGVDAGVGYQGETDTTYELFMFASYTFNQITPEAAMVLS